jgi:hypothetical protein
MTKLLSQLLEAKEPQFRQTVASLESSSGYSCEDIRLSVSLLNLSRAKIAALGLDPKDTTGEELFRALQEKLKADDQLLIKRLRKISAYRVNSAANINEGIAEAITEISGNTNQFVIKSSVAKRMLLQLPPKRMMKLLNYRSINSLIKHEPLPLIVNAALVLESVTWQHCYDNKLKSLKPQDFEDRPVKVYALNSDRWSMAAKQMLAQFKQPVLVDKELGSLIILPIPNIPVAGLTTLTLAIALNGLNDIYISSTYLRLNQVSKDFGRRLYQAAGDEPIIKNAEWFNSPLTWESVYRFFHHRSTAQKEQIKLDTGLMNINPTGWRPVEEQIHKIAPEMEYWKDCGYLSYPYGDRIVSFNVLDNALSLLNRKVYPGHYIHHAKRSLLQELMARYIRPNPLSEIINKDLGGNLEPEPVLAENY